MSPLFKVLLSLWLMQLFNTHVFAKNFYLDSSLNKGTLRFEIDNDVVWEKDSNFSNGWSLQYHTARYANWEETKAPGFIKWVGNHFPTLGDDDSIVRNGHGIGQNMFTPGDLNAEIPLEGDVPYAATLTYTLNWQNFNRQAARNFQITVGILGPEALAEELQKYLHKDLGLADDPKGWDTQRNTEPILNIGYQYPFRVAHLGKDTNDWAGQLTLAPSASLGNMATVVELSLGFRYGWNMLEGFNTFPAPPGRGFFQATYLPKPLSASPHSIEFVLGVRGTALLYSVLYDGSIITSDDRKVDRKTFIASVLAGFNYHYHKLFSVRVHVQSSTDLLEEDSIPDPPSGGEKTKIDNSYGALIIDFHF